MTKISKALVVFTTAACLAFLGFSAVSSVGGTNWHALSREPVDFAFTNTAGTANGWAVKARAAGDSFSKSGATLPEAVVAARKHLKESQDKEIAQLDKEFTEADTALKEATKLNETDRAAIQARFSQL